MKRFALLPLLALVALTGCGIFPVVRGSGFLVDSPYSFSDFTAIAAEHAFKVTVVPDTVYAVVVTCDDNLVPYLDVSQAGDQVSFGLIPYTSYVRATLTAEVHMPCLSSLDVSGAAGARVQSGFISTSDVAITASGAGSVEVLGLTCAALDLDLCGASGMSASSVVVTSLTAELSGASSLTASGSAPSESVTASGASSAHLMDMAAETAAVSLSGASRAWVDVGSGTVILSASGASTLYYGGSPVLQIEDLSGASGIHRAD